MPISPALELVLASRAAHGATDSPQLGIRDVSRARRRGERPYTAIHQAKQGGKPRAQAGAKRGHKRGRTEGISGAQTSSKSGVEQGLVLVLTPAGDGIGEVVGVERPRGGRTRRADF